MNQLALDLLAPSLQPSFDNFVVGRNAEAVAALRALVATQVTNQAASPVARTAERMKFHP